MNEWINVLESMWSDEEMLVWLDHEEIFIFKNEIMEGYGEQERNMS